MINIFENIDFKFSLTKKKTQFYKTNIYCIHNNRKISQTEYVLYKCIDNNKFDYS